LGQKRHFLPKKRPELGHKKYFSRQGYTASTRKFEKMLKATSREKPVPSRKILGIAAQFADNELMNNWA
jgi:hypothetical protein